MTESLANTQSHGDQTNITERWSSQRRNQERHKKFLELSENKSTTQQNCWDKLKAVIRGKFIPLGSNIKSTDKWLNGTIQEFGKQEQAKIL